MGMSTTVVGFAPPDERWRQMKAIWDNCKAAGISPPPEVEKFFDYREPDPNGVEVELPKREWSNDHASGFEIEIASIPKQVSVIRFYNSW